MPPKKGYGKDEKKIQLIFQDTDKRHAEFVIRLKYDGLSKSEFLRGAITAYLEKDERILEFVDEMKKNKKIGVKRRNRVKSQNKTEKETKRKFGLNEDEVENIFDILEDEHPDL